MHVPPSKKSKPDPSLAMPLDVMPNSNGEHVPTAPVERQRQVMELQERLGEAWRRRLGMNRRDFVRSAAAWAAGFTALRQATSSATAHAGHIDACDIEDPTFQLANLPGELIFDIQTHHVDLTPRPADAYVVALFMNAGRPLDPHDVLLQGDLCDNGTPFTGDPAAFFDDAVCFERQDYIRNVFLDSSTTVAVLSAVPNHEPDVAANALPTAEAACTVATVNDLARSRRSVLHHFVLPNRAKGGSLQDELDRMDAVAELYGRDLGAWKVYTPFLDYFDPSLTTGWYLSDDAGRAVVERAIRLGNRPICAHKGLVLGGMQKQFAGCGDVGEVARDYPDMRFIVYHSGMYSGPANDLELEPGCSPSLRVVPGGAGPLLLEVVGPYPLASETDLDPWIGCSGTDGLIRALRENGLSARHFAPGGQPGVSGPAGDGDPTVHANNPNVYAELGSVWRFQAMLLAPFFGEAPAAHLIGKLIYYLGPERVVWGTDAIWTGSPQQQIIAFRLFAREGSEALRILQEHYHLPYGLEGDLHDPSQCAAGPQDSIRNGIFGRNAAHAYRLNLGKRHAIDCEDVEADSLECPVDDLALLRDHGYLRHGGTERETRPRASNRFPGFRTARALFAALRDGTAG